MYFEELRLLLLERIRRSVHNGELTERGLARLIGISQPHMHNILKGVRKLSDEVADRILYYLRISVLDLCERAELQRYAGQSRTAFAAAYSYIPVLRGRLGPDDPWPAETEPHARFPVAPRLVADMSHPVVCRLGKDEEMCPLFGAGDFALLDQSLAARTEFIPGALYVIRRGKAGLLRHAEKRGGKVYTFTHASLGRSAEWQPVPAHYLGAGQYIRARAVLVAAESEWT